MFSTAAGALAADNTYCCYCPTCCSLRLLVLLLLTMHMAAAAPTGAITADAAHDAAVVIAVTCASAGHSAAVVAAAAAAAAWRYRCSRYHKLCYAWPSMLAAAMASVHVIIRTSADSAASWRGVQGTMQLLLLLLLFVWLR
jgi:hypothetical protein